MSISQKKCKVCGNEFYGQKNAMYCSTSCKQKAYRDRNKPVYKCAVNGQFRIGRQFGICGHIGIGNNIGRCTASNKCEHKVKQEKAE